MTLFQSDNYYAGHANELLVHESDRMMQIYDVSVPLNAATPIFPGDPGIQVKDWLKLAKGDSANVSLLNFGLHSGTHVDAPSHFIEGGAKVDSLPLDSLVGPAEVVEVPHSVCVIDEDFVTNNCSRRGERFLFKTLNSTFWSESERGFREDYVYIDPKAAQRLVDGGVKLVGIDYLSVEQFKSTDFQTHRILLSHGVVIIEGLDLSAVPGGTYELICLPLKIAEGSGDGAPARVILRSQD